MPIRKLKVSFEISADVFAQLLVHGNSGMNIEVYGEDSPVANLPKRVNHTKNGKGYRQGHPAKRQMVIMEGLKAGDRTLEDIRKASEAGGFSLNVNSCIHDMLERGLVKRIGVGQYALTKKGEEHVNT